MTDSQANSEAIEALLERIRRLEDAYQGGWISAVEEKWTYAGADAAVKTYTLTVPGDLAWKYGKGMRVRLKQAGITSYFIITGVAYSAPSTTLTIFGGTDHSLANSRIIEQYFSATKAPYGFPMDPNIWSVIVTNTSAMETNSPSGGTIYNTGVYADLPIGVWRVSYIAMLQAGRFDNSSWTNEFVSLSTSNSSVSDATMNIKVGGFFPNDTSGIFLSHSVNSPEKTIALTSKTRYYLIYWTDVPGVTVICIYGNQATTVIKAVCAYL
ncbi:MAG: hypothetical protein WCP70_15495 [Methanothrix sp.]